MTATLTKSLLFDVLSSTLKIDATAAVSSYVDPVTHIPARSFCYNASLDGQVWASGLRSGSVTLATTKFLGQGLHSLDIAAANGTSSERISFGADIHVYTQASSGQTIFGEADTVGSARVDYAYGSQYGDAFIMGQNDDTVEAFGGNDYIDGGTGADTMIGGAGVDWYRVDNGGDKVVELAGQGNDRVLPTISWTLGANVEELELTGETAGDGTGNTLANLLIGNAAANTLSGLESNDTLQGGAGNDTLLGGAGNDTLRGDEGADRLNGGLGQDQLWGGAGNDVFEYASIRESSALGGGADVIRDWAPGDRIDVSAIDANTDLAGDQAFVLDADGVFRAGEVRQTFADGATVLSFNTGGDATPEMTVVVQGPYGLGGGDFWL